MATWQFLCALGVIFLIVEIFAPSLVFLPLGIGILLTSVVSVWVPDPPEIILIAAILVISVFFGSRKLFSVLLPAHRAVVRTVVNRYLGRKVRVTVKVDAFEPGEVHVDGESWRALAFKEGDVFEQDDYGVVMKIDGNKLLLIKEDDPQCRDVVSH